MALGSIVRAESEVLFNPRVLNAWVVFADSSMLNSWASVWHTCDGGREMIFLTIMIKLYARVVEGALIPRREKAKRCGLFEEAKLSVVHIALWAVASMRFRCCGSSWYAWRPYVSIGRRHVLNMVMVGPM